VKKGWLRGDERLKLLEQGFREGCMSPKVKADANSRGRKREGQRRGAAAKKLVPLYQARLQPYSPVLGEGVNSEVGDSKGHIAELGRGRDVRRGGNVKDRSHRKGR